MDKEFYIRLISNMSDKYGGLLIELMEKYGRENLQEVTLDEAKEFYEKLKLNRKM